MNFNFNQFLKSALVLLFIWLTIDTSAQSAYEGIRYQAILRDGSGSVISGQNVSLRMTIYQKGDLVNGYIETHETFTNIMGLINLTIGNGIPIQNTFSSINWGKSTSNPFFIKIEFSDNDGNTFLTFGESQLLSVPYAMYAKNVENVNDADANPLNEIQDLSLSGNILEISMNSASTLIDLSPYLDNTDDQVLSFGLDDTLHLTSGGKVYLGIYDLDNRLKAHIAQYTLDQAALILRLRSLSDSAATNYSKGIINSASIQNDSARLNQAENDLKNTQDSVSVLYSAAFKDSSSTNEIQNILINVTNDSLLISDGQGVALNKLFQTDSIAIDSLEDAYKDTNQNLFLGAKPNNLVKSGTNSALNNVSVGTDALVANTSGSYNVGVGTGTLYKNTTGDNNSALGQEALSTNKVGSNNTAFGRFALQRSTASNNTSLGAESLYQNTTGNNNTASGYQALKNNRTGSGNTAIGSVADVIDTNLNYATAIGFGAIVKASNTIQLGNSSIDSIVTSGKLKLGNVIYPNTDGTSGQVLATDGSGNLSFQSTNTSSLVPYLGATQAVNLGAFDLTVNSVNIGLGSGNIATNIALGNGALRSNTTGNNNLAIGSYALEANTTGTYNTASGTNALNKNTIGRDNTASGFNALLQNTTGSDNTASGAFALNTNTTGNRNTALGTNALNSNTTGSNNTASGYNALNNNTTGAGNTAAGYEALEKNTTGNDNTAAGFEALKSNTTGVTNTASGSYALQANTIGNENTALGVLTLQSNTTGGGNTASGANALRSNTIGNNNTASGYQALNRNTTGSSNTASGIQALYLNTTGTYNTAIGFRAMEFTTTSNNNVAFGNQALKNNRTGSGNTAIGSVADVIDTNLNFATAIGFGAIVKASNTIQLGNNSIDSVVTAGKLKLGNVIYPNTDGTSGQVLATDGSGNLSWSASMPNVTRSIAIAPGMFPTEAFIGSQTKKKMLGGWQIPVIEMVDGNLGQIAMSVPLPSDWVAGTAVKIKLLYSSSSNSGSIYFSFGSAKLAENASTITATGANSVSLNVSSTANGLKEYSYSISTNSTLKVLHFTLRRKGTSSLDTNAGVMYIHGVNLEYTAK